MLGPGWVRLIYLGWVGIGYHCLGWTGLALGYLGWIRIGYSCLALVTL